MRGIKLGKVFGIEIRLHPSWVIAFFLVGYSLSFFYFPGRYEGLPRSTLVMMGLATTFLFFASILIHEISHSVVARRNGIPIPFITLFVFGGVSSISKEPDSPSVETKIAAAGPVASVLLAILFAALYALGRSAGAGVALTGVVGYLSAINIVLALFNLIPGFPLDGGRLLRATVWQRTADLQRATKVAASCGRAFAVALIVAGVGFVFAGYLISGLWFIFIGLFLDQAARGSYRQVVVSHGLSEVSVEDVMTPAPTTIPANIPLRAAVDRYFLPNKFGGFPVVDGGEAVGVISLADVRDVPSTQWNVVRVADAMQPLGPKTVISSDAHMTDLLARLHTFETDWLLVLDRDRHVSGIVTGDDVAQYMNVQVTLRAA